MIRIEAAARRLVLFGLVWAGAHLPLHAGVTRLDVSYYNDYAVELSVGHHNETVYASALTASYIPGAPHGAQSTPLPPGYPASFTTFSLDIRYDLVSEAYWQPGALPSSNANGAHDHRLPLWKPGGIYRAASLYDAFVGDVNTATAAGRLEGAALQLAIWDVLYGDGKAVDHRGSGFYIRDPDGSESQLVFAANAILASSANNVDLDADATFWNAVLGPNGRRPLADNQDLIGPGIDPVGAVPEASAWFAGTAAAAGLCLLGNRRLSKRKN